MKASPSDGVLHHSLGNVLMMAGKHGDAVFPFLEDATRLLPGDATVAADLGVVLSNLGEHDRAVDALREVVGTGAESPEALHALVASLAALGDLKAAEPVVRKLETKYPESPPGTPGKTAHRRGMTLPITVQDRANYTRTDC